MKKTIRYLAPFYFLALQPLTLESGLDDEMLIGKPPEPSSGDQASASQEPLTSPPESQELLTLYFRVKNTNQLNELKSHPLAEIRDFFNNTPFQQLNELDLDIGSASEGKEINEVYAYLNDIKDQAKTITDIQSRTLFRISVGKKYYERLIELYQPDDPDFNGVTTYDYLMQALNLTHTPSLYDGDQYVSPILNLIHQDSLKAKRIVPHTLAHAAIKLFRQRSFKSSDFKIITGHPNFHHNEFKRVTLESLENKNYQKGIAQHYPFSRDVSSNQTLNLCQDSPLGYLVILLQTPSSENDFAALAHQKSIAEEIYSNSHLEIENPQHRNFLLFPINNNTYRHYQWTQTAVRTLLRRPSFASSPQNWHMVQNPAILYDLGMNYLNTADLTLTPELINIYIKCADMLIKHSYRKNAGFLLSKIYRILGLIDSNAAVYHQMNRIKVSLSKKIFNHNMDGGDRKKAFLKYTQGLTFSQGDPIEFLKKQADAYYSNDPKKAKTLKNAIDSFKKSTETLLNISSSSILEKFSIRLERNDFPMGKGNFIDSLFLQLEHGIQFPTQNSLKDLLEGLEVFYFKPQEIKDYAWNAYHRVFWDFIKKLDEQTNARDIYAIMVKPRSTRMADEKKLLNEFIEKAQPDIENNLLESLKKDLNTPPTNGEKIMNEVIDELKGISDGIPLIF